MFVSDPLCLFFLLFATSQGSQSAARAAAQTVPVGSTNMALAERFIVIPYGCFRPETAAQCERVSVSSLLLPSFLVSIMFY